MNWAKDQTAANRTALAFKLPVLKQTDEMKPEGIVQERLQSFFKTVC